MSKAYDNYLAKHNENVVNAMLYLMDYLPERTKGVDCMKIMEEHDASKYHDDEYRAYDDYFYGGEKTEQVIERFNKAWLTHIHRNPHHWQHWVLLQDDPDLRSFTKMIEAEMPYEYVLEMICDWWSFSWEKGDLCEIFAWWEEHKKRILLHKNTAQLVEDILLEIKDCLVRGLGM